MNIRLSTDGTIGAHHVGDGQAGLSSMHDRKTRPPSNTGDIKIVEDLLSDGQWHRQKEVIDALGGDLLRATKAIWWMPVADDNVNGFCWLCMPNDDTPLDPPVKKNRKKRKR